MDVTNVAIDKVIPYARNPRKNDKAIPRVAASLKEFGWQQPIVVDKDNVVIVGHTRLEAARSLGMTEVPVLVADKLTPQQAKAYRIVDNRSAEFSSFDEDLLLLEIEELINTDYDIDNIGYSDTDIKLMNHPHVEYNPGSLSDSYIIPPFSVWDTRQKYWLDRKRLWRSLINDFGESREKCLADTDPVYGSFGNRNGKKIEMVPGVSLLDPVVCEISLRWFNINGGKAFDPFAGDTVFGFVSGYLGYPFTGIELRQDQADVNQSRIDELDLPCKYICDDGQNVLKHIKENSQDFLFSCPPYYDLEVYSDLENDASNQESYEDFLQILDNAFSGSIKCLKDDRFAVIVCGDIRDENGMYRRFPEDIIDIFNNNNMPLYNRVVLLEPIGTAPIRASKTLNASRKVVKTHQDVLVFYKGDLENIQYNFDTLSKLSENRESVEAHQNVLVFYKGDPKNIKKNFKELEGLSDLAISMETQTDESV